MDEVARYNKERWEELARANVLYSRPYLDLDADGARRIADPAGVFGEVDGKDVLCLASGGGQQSAAFAVLGARVTVLDLSETQLERDLVAARHYGLQVRTVQGDMRDLSAFEDAAFDVVYHPYSLDFVPDPQRVFGEVARVLRVGGIYRLQWHNPFIKGVDEDEWDGQGYPLSRIYRDGEVDFKDDRWDVDDGEGTTRRIGGPREFRHTLSTVVNGLVGLGFVVLRVAEEDSGDPDAEPGTWEHFKAVAPPWLSLWTTYRPSVFG